MAVYKGRLYCGTLPAGHVYSYEAGRNVTYDYELAHGWKHVVALKDEERPCRLKIFVDGQLAAESSPFNGYEAYISNDEPLTIGFGPQDYFYGSMRELRIYDRPLNDLEITELYKHGKNPGSSTHKG